MKPYQWALLTAMVCNSMDKFIPAATCLLLAILWPVADRHSASEEVGNDRS